MKAMNLKQKIVNQVNDTLIVLRNAVNKRQFLKMKILINQSTSLQPCLNSINNKKLNGSKY